MASRPVPTTPIVKIAKANGPAIGFKASAAWLEVWISVVPVAWRVAAVVNIIARATRLENAIPVYVSTLIRSIASGPCSGDFASGFLAFTFLISSTSCEACQKKRYGLIVVPKIATTTVQKPALLDNVGTKKPRAASNQGTFTTIAVPK